jgi:nitroimidazol reductase NimA-like FMN-containing flavoprotein (pyridoxamine 5'-phosphate oxidase superfamily)
MRALTDRGLDYLRKHELGRLATASTDARPHVVPVMYAMDGDDVVIAIDYGTKKLKNLRENKMVALVVDEYGPGGGISGVMLQGTCEMTEKGKEYLRLLKVLFDRFEVYRKNPWGEGESPIVKIHVEKCVVW